MIDHDDHEESVAGELLREARTMVDRATDDTRGLWPRAAVLLARQSLEVALKTFWSLKAPGAEGTSTRAQLLCLGTYIGDEVLARRAGHVWASLSRAAHFHPYELPPTQDELRGWCDTIGELVVKTEKAWRA